ncbi:2,4-dienoyl-CoA reductase (NADPH2) [Microbotryum lychnidis-dioicae p1A1 Lamole]|uniref:2,4-dienoyl-CoA reductase [(3E)-enoyl-CoA-producing] n=1 Tax=Microbotryum lychnidis-dioicae (strain p1A1 Lamole / MvSl-1064) TaxID=683840 RepID=U5H6N0_USTV1|nr:2,4-dienoyl-CoA reductase (NADPH2) [Microbotryum lychnidis-dioicae p1A1 Lamole]|eukprot:KDE06732.1 2,4-dienoyl-CoA reductase (NADPH2) [Microbotryum lychnidis-dioicae p1A1 Lamole]
MTSSIFKDDLFKGKVAFVTGGGSGICYGMVKSLMRHGANATILGRREQIITEAAATLSKATGQQCLGVSGDVRKPESLKEAVRKTVEKFGRIDFVICGAAGNFLSPISGMSENAFRTVLEIDSMGTFNTFKATIDEVKKTRGAYIAISATLHYKGTVMQAHVSAAKAAIDSLFNVIAVEYGPLGVRANIIAPGPIDGTEGVARLIPKEIIEESKKLIPLGRNGTIEDIANSGVFLFSPAASYITGSVLVVDGGQWHNGSMSRSITYPDFLLEGGDTRSTLAAKL